MQTKDPLNYEDKDSYRVIVSVSDSTHDAVSIDVTITVTDVNEAPTFAEGTDTDRSVAEDTAPRTDFGDPVVATDPDTRTPAYADLTYRLSSRSGSDAAAFFLNPVTRRLQLREPLDYESRSRPYQVTVHVSDGRDANGTADDMETDATLDVTINVTNVDEAGMVELSPGAPQEKQELTATLSDPDERLSGIRWQWERALNLTPGDWLDIDGATSNQYTPEMADVDHYLRATASYTDGDGMGKAASATTTEVVQAAPQVSLVLSDTDHAIREGETLQVQAVLTRASEDETKVELSEMRDHYTLSGTTLTIPVGATQSNAVTLTAADNDVDGPAETTEVTVTGRLTKNLLVKAPDPVTLTITDDDARGVTLLSAGQPIPAAGLSIREHDEGETPDAATYTVGLASEPTATVTIAVASSEAAVHMNPARLEFTPRTWKTAQPVRVTTIPDADAENETATITHRVTGGDYGTVQAAAVSVTVTDDERPSTTVTLSVDPAEVRESQPERVTVTGTLNGATRSTPTTVDILVAPGTATQGTDFTADQTTVTLTIPADTKSGTTTFVLTPENDRIDEPDETVTVRGSTTATGLTVTPTTVAVTIEDNDAPPEVTLLSAESISESGRDNSTTVTATLNHPSSEVTTVTVLEAPAGEYWLSGTRLAIPAEATASTGTPVTLTAVDNDTDDQDKQVTVRGRAENDLTVSGPAVVTLTITDDDPPEVSGETPLSYTEHTPTLVVATYTASNPDPRTISITWSLAGTDKDAFTISNGELRFRETPDYEDPNNLDREYEVTVQASDGPFTGELAVMVTVADAPGKVELPSTPPQIGTPFTATLYDPDGVDADKGREWCWERSRFPNFPVADPSTLQIDCDAQTTATYTPVNDDHDHFLRVTATYTDSDGTPNKTASRDSEELVAVRPPDSLRPPPNPPGGGPPGEPAPEPEPDPEPAPEPVGMLENPGPGSRQSGIGLLSGWVCAAEVVELEINGTQRVAAAYGTDRADTAPVCGDRDNGFGLLFNWNLLGDGVQTVVAVADGVAFDQATFTVTTLGEEFVTDAVGETVLADFPTAGEEVRLVWQQANQNFVLAPLDGDPPPASPPGSPDGPVGALENPGPASFQSGLGLLSGWVCEAEVVELEINGGARIAAAYGTARADTAPVCGDPDNGFGLLFNWNLLGDGVQTVVAVADGDEFGRATFTVTTLGVEFLEGMQGETVAEDFPSPGEEVRLIWQQATQNFVLAPIQ